MLIAAVVLINNTPSVSILLFFFFWKTVHKLRSFQRGSDDIADSGLKFGAWRKPDSYLGGAKPESCSWFIFAAMALSSSPLCSIIHRSEPQFQTSHCGLILQDPDPDPRLMETQFILAQKTEAIGEKCGFFIQGG